MLTVYAMQWKRLIKKPFLVLLFMGLTIMMVTVVAGSQGNQKTTVRAFSETLSSDQLDTLVNTLNEDENFNFEQMTREDIQEDIRMDRYGYGVNLDTENYRFLVGRESQTMAIVDQYLQQFYREKNTLAEVRADFPGSDLEANEVVKIQTNSLTELSGNITSMSVILGMTFYFSIYSILFLMLNLFEEKKSGTWNRLIFSPISKTQLYLGHLVFYVTIGFLQVLTLFIILSQLLSIEFTGNTPALLAITFSYILCIVSIGILLTALSRTVSMLQVIIPIVATAMAMLGGAFWPLQVVNNAFLEFAAELMPIKHAVYGMMETILQNRSFLESIQPISILLLMSVLFMGVGINLMERVSR